MVQLNKLHLRRGPSDVELGVVPQNLDITDITHITDISDILDITEITDITNTTDINDISDLTDICLIEGKVVSKY